MSYIFYLPNMAVPWVVQFATGLSWVEPEFYCGTVHSTVALYQSTS